MQQVKLSKLKLLSKESLKDNWDLALVSTLIYSLVILIPFSVYGTLCGFRSYRSLALVPNSWVILPTKLWAVFLWGGIELGIALVFLNFVRKKEASLRQLFAFFTEGKLFVNSVAFYVIRRIYIVLWTLLLVVPGIVKTYSYAMAPYLLNDNQGLSANEAITRSRSLMHGNKCRLFLLDLSFLGWFLLVVASFGLANFYVMPYYQATRAQFYENLKEAEASQA